jgi:hypothetical protein
MLRSGIHTLIDAKESPFIRSKKIIGFSFSANNWTRSLSFMSRQKVNVELQSAGRVTDPLGFLSTQKKLREPPPN